MPTIRLYRLFRKSESTARSRFPGLVFPVKHKEGLYANAVLSDHAQPIFYGSKSRFEMLYLRILFPEGWPIL